MPIGSSSPPSETQPPTWNICTTSRARKPNAQAVVRRTSIRTSITMCEFIFSIILLGLGQPIDPGLCTTRSRGGVRRDCAPCDCADLLAPRTKTPARTPGPNQHSGRFLAVALARHTAPEGHAIPSGPGPWQSKRSNPVRQTPRSLRRGVRWRRCAGAQLPAAVGLPTVLMHAARAPASGLVRDLQLAAQ